MTQDELLGLAKLAGFSVRNGEIFSMWKEDYNINDELELFSKLIIARCIDCLIDDNTDLMALMKDAKDE